MLNKITTLSITINSNIRLGKTDFSCMNLSMTIKNNNENGKNQGY